MAHFAQLDEHGVVLQVIVIDNSELIHENDVEDEQRGVAFCQSLFGADTVWVQTSYNGRIRKNYAGIGYTYDAQRDAFILPKPFASWVLNEETCQWRAPIPMPQDDNAYIWNETMNGWEIVTPDDDAGTTETISAA